VRAEAVTHVGWLDLNGAGRVHDGIMVYAFTECRHRRSVSFCHRCAGCALPGWQLAGDEGGDRPVVQAGGDRVEQVLLQRPVLSAAGFVD